MKNYVIGIDMGGTAVKIGLFTEEGALLDKAEIPYHQVADGDTFTLGDAQVTVLRRDSGSVNDRSAVLNIRFGESTALLTADIAGGTQHWLADRDPAHHRSERGLTVATASMMFCEAIS